MTNRRRRLTDAEIETALCRYGGVLSFAAAELSVSRQAIHYRLSVSPHLREKSDDQNAELLELSLAAIYQGVRAGHLPTIRWYLDHFARDRGYGRQSKRSLKDTARIQKNRQSVLVPGAVQGVVFKKKCAFVKKSPQIVSPLMWLTG